MRGLTMCYRIGSEHIGYVRKVGLSEKAFKRAIGGLYKARRIRLDAGGISSIS
ncbi:MAG: hypothetical protein AAF721_09660 [Myxococcota bacterium]